MTRQKLVGDRVEVTGANPTNDEIGPHEDVMEIGNVNVVPNVKKVSPKPLKKK